jgi:hypothetical protein
MGKNLIVKDADFSENGFKYEIVEIQHNELYDSNNNLVTQETWPISAPNGKYYYASKNQSIMRTGLNLANSCVSGIVPIPSSTLAIKIRTRVENGYISDDVAGLVLFAFLNESNQIISGFASSEEQSQIGDDSPLIASGLDIDKLVEVPENAVSIITTYTNLLTPLDTDNYKLSFLPYDNV